MDDALATQLASAMTGTAAGDYRTDATTAAATFTVKEKFQLFTVHGRVPVGVADVAIDADGLPRGTATLDVAAIKTPNARRDHDLHVRMLFETRESAGRDLEIAQFERRPHERVARHAAPGHPAAPARVR